jgi:hypothetical protein
MANEQRLAEAVRAACIKAALEAYEDGGILGLCAEGRWEYAISAMQQLDVATIIRMELPELPTTAMGQD